MRKLFTLRTLWSVLFCLLISGISKTQAAVGDAGVQALLTPVSPVCKGTSSVSVIIHNFGGITISTTEVHWRVNGSGQPTYNYSGNIGAGGQDTVTIGNFNFTTGPYTVKIWTKNPNGSADSDNSNDTIEAVVNVSSALTGTYTIAGASPDFVDFNAAVNALVTNGICGAVTFNIRPYTDTMQVVIPEIAGADTFNTITFQAENGDSSSVILTYPSQDTLINNHLISLNGADFITFNKLTLERTGTRANGHVIEFTNNATHNTVTHCRLIGVTGTTINSLAAILYSSSVSTYNDSMNTFTYNLIKNGSLGIYMNGISSLSLEYNNIISFNTFINQYSKGIQNTNQGATQIEGNTFTTTSNYAGYTSIWLDRSLRIHHIIKNKILAVPGAGMYFVDCTAQSGVHGVVANNFIQSNDSAGISMVNCDYQDIVHNSILMTGATSNFAALLMRGSGVGKVVKNNILANTGGGYSYVVSDSAVFGIIASDHNNLYATGSFIGNYNGTPVTTLANWISASHRDSASLNVNPSFVSASDLHVASIAMDDRGTHVNNVSDDIDGQTRSLVTPDIGADEYSSISRSVGITAILSPMDSTCGSAATQIIAVVSNTGGNPESNFNCTVKVTGSSTNTFNFNHTATLQPGASDTITFANTLNTAAGGVYNIKVYTSLNVDDVHANDTLTYSYHLFAPPTSPTVTPASICGAGSDTLLASSSDTLLWYSASTGGTLLATGPSFITPNVNATTTYYVAAKSACEGPRVSVALTVNPVPNVVLGNDTSINQGNSIILNAGVGFTSYLWSPGNQTTSTLSVNTSACYSVRVTNSSGCTNRDTICVSVLQPNDVGVITMMSPVNHDCANDTIQVLVKVSNLGSSDATSIPVHVNITGAVTATFTDTITSTITAGNNLVLNMGSVNLVAGGNIVVTAYTAYSNDLNHSNDTIVEHDTLLLQPVIPGGIGALRCGPGIVVLIASASNPVHWFDAPSGGTELFVGTNYVIPNLTSTTTYYAQNGAVCNTQDRRPVTATIRALPNVFLGNDTTAADSLVLHAGNWSSYQWSDNSTNSTLTIHNTGSYSVCITDTNGCQNCDTIDVGIYLGIEQIAAIGDVNLYPNPAHSSVNVEMKKQIPGTVLFTITNMQGQLVLNETANNVTKHTLNVANFARGIYYLQVRTEEGISSYRLIIE
jgi:hypothetical protein